MVGHLLSHHKQIYLVEFVYVAYFLFYFVILTTPFTSPVSVLDFLILCDFSDCLSAPILLASPVTCYPPPHLWIYCVTHCFVSVLCSSVPAFSIYSWFSLWSFCLALFSLYLACFVDFNFALLEMPNLILAQPSVSCLIIWIFFSLNCPTLLLVSAFGPFLYCSLSPSLYQSDRTTPGFNWSGSGVAQDHPFLAILVCLFCPTS